MKLPRWHRRQEPEPATATMVRDVVAAAAPSDAPPPGASAAVGSSSGWNPIVVDQPVAEFAPRPPQGTNYRPDSMVDGWSTDHVAVRLASVRGYAHRFYREPRQDDAVLAFHEPTQSVVFAVADGVSNARLPEVGARLVCQTAVDVLTVGLAKARVNWYHLAESVALRLIEQARSPEHARPGDSPRSPEDFATTLVAGHIAPTAEGLVATMIQIGDSSAWLLADGEFRDVLTPKSQPGAAVVSSAVAALPALPKAVSPVSVPLEAGSVLLVGTDGIGDPLGDGTGLVGDLFRTVLREPPPLLEFAHAVDFSRETFDDDRTLLAIWPRPPVPPRRGP